MKSVAIIGAGPGGLVAAKTFLQTKKFAVTIYEKNATLGGIWAIEENTTDAWLTPSTPTNLSRYTVGFSGLDWNGVDLETTSYGTKEREWSASAPMFPKAWHVKRYLAAYQRKYVPEDVLHFDRKVILIDRVVAGGSVHWDVTTTLNGHSATVTASFDYVIIASGFFSEPKALGGRHVDSASEVKAIHTSQYRGLEDLFSPTRPGPRKNILVYGGGNSSGETAAAIAMHLSDSQWSPNKARQELYKDCKVIHVMPRPLYTLPPFVEYESGSRTYVPVDFKLYDLSKRPAGAIESYGGRQPRAVQNMVHGFLQTMIGGDQSDISPALVSVPGESRGTVRVALAETHAEFVRSGRIQVISGRVSSIGSASIRSTTATISSGETDVRIDEVDAIVSATGYTPVTALDFLADDVRKSLSFDAHSTRLPVLLENCQTSSSAVPELAFIGFYEGPYWPFMEMQARLIAERWLHDAQKIALPFEEPSRMIDLRQAMQSRAPDVPQYWFGDYLGYMEHNADVLKLHRNDGAFGPRGGCPSPARYLSVDAKELEDTGIMHDLHRTWRQCTVDGMFVARAVFRALQGTWTISRRISSNDASFNGTLEGTASFHPRSPTPDKSGERFDLEYLYIEAGSFTSANGMTMTARRRYVYRYSEATDKLSVWFVKPERDLEVDYLFHGLSFIPPAEAREAGACVAKADHLCVDDMYYTEYRLPMNGVSLPRFSIKHAVKGPSKDYIATTQYCRPTRA